MSENVELLEEPKLLFGSNHSCRDPKLGLLCYGPSGLDTETGKSRIIRAGAIGTHSAIAHLKLFLSRLSFAISSEESSFRHLWRVPFPGLGVAGPLGFEIALDPDAMEYISGSEEEEALGDSNRKMRIENAVSVYDQKFKDLENSSIHPPDIILVPLSKLLVKKCRDPTMKGDRIVYARRTLAKNSMNFYVPIFDFHHVLKVISFSHHMACQVLRPSTMSFSARLQDPATIAWNFVTAAYYKGTGIPWKLADLDDKTCLVGISFYEELAGENASMRASMAHVYVKSAESQIIRGKPFPWEGNDSRREPSLTAEQAREILTDVIGLFSRQRGTNPERVVVHKSSGFTSDEIDGFNQSSSEIPTVDYVHIESLSGLQFFHRGYEYPPVRGSLITSITGPPSVLYTVGFVPSLGTYQGGTTPNPLVLHPARLDTSLRQISADIMSLTKLDWNSTDFSTRQPVTTSVSRKVGHVLAEMRARDIEPPQAYRYYM